MKLVIILVLAMGCSVAIFAAVSGTGSKTLDRWVGGQWLSTGQFVDTDFSKASQVSGTTKCGWSPDHVFVICDQDITFAGQAMRELSIYTVDPKSGKYFFYGISLGEAKARNTDLEISDDGNRWIYSSADESKGKTVQWRTTNQFHGDDAVEWWSEFSTDGGKTWTKTGTGKEVREK